MFIIIIFICVLTYFCAFSCCPVFSFLLLSFFVLSVFTILFYVCVVIVLFFRGVREGRHRAGMETGPRGEGGRWGEGEGEAPNKTKQPVFRDACRATHKDEMTGNILTTKTHTKTKAESAEFPCRAAGSRQIS